MQDRPARNNHRSMSVGIAITLLAAGCTGGSSGSPNPGYTPTFASSECPGPVTASATRETTCGFLTVPEDRSNPSGRQVRLFVVRLAPLEVTAAPPVVYVGNDLGSPFDWIALSGMADNLDGPEVIGIEARGTGYSQPNLSCPELDAIEPKTLTTSVASKDLRDTFIGAVKACHDRFVGQGIDLSAYGVQDAAADVIDLVETLGLSTWDVIGKGSASRIVFAALTMDPPGLRTIVATNPEFPDTDPFVQAIASTRAAVWELGTLCDADPRCARRFPDLTTTFDAALHRFDERPVTVRIAGRSVLVDGARLLLDFRNLMSVIGDDPMYLHLPATIDNLAHAADPTRSIDAVVSPEIDAPPFCMGYLPRCGTVMNMGAYWSALCIDIAPFTDPAALAAAGTGERAWTDDYVNNPYLGVCGAWDVTPGDASVATPIASGLPMLMFAGGLDPIVSPAAVHAGLSKLPNAFLIDVPVNSHSLGFPPNDCPPSSPRNEFLADPTTAPDARCAEHFQPTFASSPLQG
jgi:pimeloyl-ACP methyl ester carboxylesterase